MKPTLLTIGLLVLSMMALDLYQSCPAPVNARSDEAVVIQPPQWPPAYPMISVKRTTLRSGEEIWVFASHRYAAAIRSGNGKFERVRCWYALPDSPFRETDICPGTFHAQTLEYAGSSFILDEGKGNGIQPADPLAGVETRGVTAELRGRRDKDAGVSRISFYFDTSPPRK